MLPHTASPSSHCWSLLFQHWGHQPHFRSVRREPSEQSWDIYSLLRLWSRKTGSFLYRTFDICYISDANKLHFKITYFKIIQFMKAMPIHCW